MFLCTHELLSGDCSCSGLSTSVMHAQVAGGGRSSARETIGRVAAGALAKKLLRLVAGVEVTVFLSHTPCLDQYTGSSWRVLFNLLGSGV